ncbi:MAG: hypothetical protein GXP45_07480 [bacterium]|nr:hypothetical protein [bacterium]
MGASLGVFPILIFFMGKMNLITVLGNLLVLPLIAILMIYGLVAIPLTIIIPRSGFIYIAKSLLYYVYRVSDQLNHRGVFLQVEVSRFKYSIVFAFVIYFFFWYYHHKKASKETSNHINKIPVDTVFS